MCCEHCQTTAEDHDLLIKMNTTLDFFIKGQYKSRADHELRIRRLEKYGFIGLGFLLLSEFLIGLYVGM